LAARSLMPSPWHAAGPKPTEVPRLLVQRHLRLARPYLVALGLVLLAATAARALIQDVDTPAAPDVPQLLANALFLQDILNQPALSAGLWYVAIDLQLFAVLAVLASLRRLGRKGSRLNRLSRLASVLSVAGLTIASLLWFNLQAELDAWAPYFFGAYGLGVLAHWTLEQERRSGLQLALGALVLLALALEWRSRVAVAGGMALLLAGNPGARQLAANALAPVVGWLARSSYALFLVHYPVVLLVGAVVHNLWPGEVLPNALGLLAAWAGSLMMAGLLHRTVEQSRVAPRPRATASQAWAAQRF